MSPERKAIRESFREEARRVAAAFAMDSFKPEYPQTVETWVGSLGEAQVYYRLHYRTGKLQSIDILYLWGKGVRTGKERNPSCSCHVYYNDDMWKIVSQSAEFETVMARGLYCFGFEDKRVLGLLPSLSMHEKAECHHRLPREFWPESWLSGRVV